jgi:hypothetical protein
LRIIRKLPPSELQQDSSVPERKRMKEGMRRRDERDGRPEVQVRNAENDHFLVTSKSKLFI